MDAQAQQEAKKVLAGLFSDIGRSSQRGEPTGILGGLDVTEQIQEFVMMPADLATIFMTMGVDLAELVLKALAEAGYTLVKGLTPA